MDLRVFNDAPIGIALIGVIGDDCGRIVKANRTLGALLASTPEELTGSSLCELIHGEDRARAADEFARMISRAEVSCEGEGRLLAKDGGVRRVRVHVDLLPTDGVARAVAITRIVQIAELARQPDG
jgi:PAS domain S-box-containing protein